MRSWLHWLQRCSRPLAQQVQQQAYQAAQQGSMHSRGLRRQLQHWHRLLSSSAPVQVCHADFPSVGPRFGSFLLAPPSVCLRTWLGSLDDWLAAASVRAHEAAAPWDSSVLEARMAAAQKFADDCHGAAVGKPRRRGSPRLLQQQKPRRRKTE